MRIKGFVCLLLVACAGCDSQPRVDGSGSRPLHLAFHICVNADEVDNPHQLRQQLSLHGGTGVIDDQMVWRPVRKAEVVTGDAANPLAAFGSRGLVAGVYMGQTHLLLWNNKARSTSSRRDGWSLRSAGATRDQQGGNAIVFSLDDAGAERVGDLTANNIGRVVAPVAGNHVLVAPTIRDRIASSGMITTGGDGFTNDDVDWMLAAMEE